MLIAIPTEFIGGALFDAGSHNKVGSPHHMSEDNMRCRFCWVTSIGEWCEKIVVWGAIIFFATTGLVSLLVTTIMPKYSYVVVFVTDNWWLILIGACVCILILALLDHASILGKINNKVLSSILAWYGMIFGSAWALIANVWPEWDPLYVLKAAQFARRPDHVITCPGEAEVSWILCPGGYLEKFPYQIPLVFFDRVLIFIFGNNAYLAFELINAACIAVVFVLIGRLSDAIFADKRAVNVSLLLCFAFLPLVFYVTFAYGNLLSLPFVLAALLLQVNYFKSYKLRYAVCAVICILIGIIIKSTMIYVLVAMIMVWLIEALKERNLKSVVSIVISIALYPSVGFVTSATANYFDLNPNIGEPKTVWFAMGMQKPSKQSPNNYGWYNGFPLTWKPERYDVSQVERDSMESIKRSMRDFAADPAYAFNFFSKKYISEWTDPLYESLLASNWSIHGATRPTMSKRPMTKVQRSVYYGKGNRIILYVTDVLQFLLLLGATVSLFYNRKTMQIGSLSLAIIPVGMALLYLFWEAQSQYIMPAYIMMIPYAGSGLTFIGRTILCVTKKLISYARPSYA